MIIFHLKGPGVEYGFISYNFKEDMFEMGLKILSEPGRDGWYLCTVEYFSAGMKSPVTSPLEAFDGQPMVDPLVKLIPTQGQGFLTRTGFTPIMTGIW